VSLGLFGRQERKQRELELGERLPPGQRLTDGWPVLHYGSIPRFDEAAWRFHIVGDDFVEEPVSFTWAEFQALPRTDVLCDIHCVTHWSKFDNVFSGVLVSEIMQHVRFKRAPAFVMVHSYGGYTTNISYEELTTPDVLLADKHNGEPLTPEHGYPLRLVVPKLYFWKSAKWVRGFEFMDRDRPGFWETYGYHIHGDPWKEERYS
jgi:DMSO/TMAO reductase YedYZ molybdopterin-dependent catalytic subunit